MPCWATPRRTKDYMAPELRNGEGAGQGYLGTAVDVWAAGVLLVVMLLGNPPPHPPLLARAPAHG